MSVRFWFLTQTRTQLFSQSLFSGLSVGLLSLQKLNKSTYLSKPNLELSLFVGASLPNRPNRWRIAWSSERMLNDAKQSPSGQLIIIFHTYCSIIGRSIIHRSILCRFYVLTHLLNVVSLFCLSMFCRTLSG